MRLRLKPAVIVAALASVVVAGCSSYPTSSTVQGGSSSAIYFEAFPEDASISVNGQPVGTIAQYNGKDQVLAVEPGTHVVRVTRGGAVLHDGKVYVGRNSALKISR